MGLQSLAECGLGRRDIGRQVVPCTCGNNREGTVATVDSLTGGTTRRLGRSATRLSSPRYCGVSPCKILYARTAILN